MGSFNETCMVSGLPVCCGDKVRVILIKKSPYGDGKGLMCYSHDLWSPVCPPLRGEYDDYGQVTLAPEEKDLVAFTLKTLKSVHVPVELGENEYHDIAVPNIDTWGMVEQACIEGRLVFKNAYSKVPTSPVNRVLIREDVWQSLLAVPAYGSWMPQTLATLRENANDHFKAFVGLGNDPHKIFMASFGAETYREDRIPFSLYFGGEGFSFIIKNQFFTAIQGKLAESTWTLETPVFQQVCEAFCELVFVSGQFRSPGRMWAPMMTSGQEQDWALCATFYKAMAQIAEAEANKDAIEEAKWKAEEAVIMAEYRAEKKLKREAKKKAKLAAEEATKKAASDA